ncbi:MAG: ribosomal protein [Dehalococcoidia bacterium]|nr:ribosomal protein [Dehalococcoidia bacterium]
MLKKEEKEQIIRDYEVHPQDTGSIEVQVALLTRRIIQLTDHFRMHRHDFHSQRGLLMLVAKRRRSLNYLSREDNQRYRALISRLELRR